MKTRRANNTNFVFEIAGWIGVILVLGGYCLLATGIITGDSWLYHAFILFGSTFLGAISFKKKNYQSVVLNSFFVLFAVIALTRLVL